MSSDGQVGEMVVLLDSTSPMDFMEAGAAFFELMSILLGLLATVLTLAFAVGLLLWVVMLFELSVHSVVALARTSLGRDETSVRTRLGAITEDFGWFGIRTAVVLFTFEMCTLFILTLGKGTHRMAVRQGKEPPFGDPLATMPPMWDAFIDIMMIPGVPFIIGAVLLFLARKYAPAPYSERFLTDPKKEDGVVGQEVENAD